MPINVEADPIEISTIMVDATVQFGLVMAAEPICIRVTGKGVISHWPVATRNPDLDTTLSRYVSTRPTMPITIYGEWLNKTIVVDPIEISFTVHGGIVDSFTIVADPVIITILPKTADFTTEVTKTNVVAWSNIGSVDFTIGRDNIAGERPMDWTGWVYRILKLGGKVVVYGQNGVSILIPSGNAWGMQTVYRVGLKGQGAVCGDDFLHFFIDNKGKLFKMGEKIDILDYSEYLSLLSNRVVMSMDILNKLVYICDGIYGFVYSINDKSLGTCSPYITGIGTKNGTNYVASYKTLVDQPFEICTDIYDMDSRKNKTINSLEFSTDSDYPLWAAVDYRQDKTADFATSYWTLVNPNGLAVIPCYGVEFRFRLKNLVYNWFKLNRIKINGVIHGYSYLDSLTSRGV